MWAAPDQIGIWWKVIQAVGISTVSGRVPMVSRKAKIAVAVALLLGLGLSSVAIYAHRAAIARGDRLFDLDGLETASAEEMDEAIAWFHSLSSPQKRRIAHRALARPKGNHHDALIVLTDHGDQSSIPYLLDWLKAQGELRGDGIVCTRSHCIEALEKITGKKLGYNYSTWKDWDCPTANHRIEADTATPDEGDAGGTE